MVTKTRDEMIAELSREPENWDLDMLVDYAMSSIAGSLSELDDAALLEEYHEIYHAQNEPLDFPDCPLCSK